VRMVARFERAELTLELGTRPRISQLAQSSISIPS
jgi:hypothetical protein